MDTQEPRPRFQWDEKNREHIGRHGVRPEEAESVLAGRAYVRRGRHKLYVALGRTRAGRHLFLVFKRAKGGPVRVVTARTMDEKERRLYRREVKR